MAIRKRGGRYNVEVYTPATQRNRTVGTYDTLKEAREAEAKARLKARTGGRRETVKSFSARWMVDYRQSRKESTRAHYTERVAAFAREFGHRRMDSIEKPEARKWATDHGGSLGPLRAMFNNALEDRIVDENPFANLKIPQGRGRSDIDAPSMDEVTLLASKAEEAWPGFGARVFGPMILFAGHTGLRPGELFGLRWSDVDTKGSTVRVVRQYNSKLRQFTSPKNGLSRNVPLTPQAADALQAVSRTSSELVFVTPSGALFTSPLLNRYWHPVRVAAGMQGRAFYELRHAYGTMLAKAGVGAPEIGKAMGHRDGGVLALRRYIHATERHTHDSIMRAVGAGVRDFAPRVIDNSSAESA